MRDWKAPKWAVLRGRVRRHSSPADRTRHLQSTRRPRKQREHEVQHTRLFVEKPRWSRKSQNSSVYVVSSFWETSFNEHGNHSNENLGLILPGCHGPEMPPFPFGNGKTPVWSVRRRPPQQRFQSQPTPEVREKEKSQGKKGPSLQKDRWQGKVTH